MKDYIEFQDRAFPLAYLITIRCYGTWLHGDERYSVDRSKFNIYGKPKLPPRAGLKNKEFSALKAKPIALDKMARKIVEEAIKEVCKFREYVLLAINIRSNHAHMVVTAKSEPEFLMNSFKAYATRSLRKEKLFGPDEQIWSRHGSTRYLWKEEHIESAIDYVLYGQGEIPEFI